MLFRLEINMDDEGVNEYVVGMILHHLATQMPGHFLRPEQAETDGEPWIVEMFGRDESVITARAEVADDTFDLTRRIKTVRTRCEFNDETKRFETKQEAE